MVVKELLEWLSTQPPNTKIVVRGYEGGYSDLSVTTPITLQRDVDKEDPYCGPHRESQLGEAHILLCATRNGRD